MVFSTHHSCFQSMLIGVISVLVNICVGSLSTCTLTLGILHAMSWVSMSSMQNAFWAMWPCKFHIQCSPLIWIGNCLIQWLTTILCWTKEWNMIQGIPFAMWRSITSLLMIWHYSRMHGQKCPLLMLFSNFVYLVFLSIEEILKYYPFHAIHGSISSWTYDFFSWVP